MEYASSNLLTSICLVPTVRFPFSGASFFEKSLVSMDWARFFKASFELISDIESDALDLLSRLLPIIDEVILSIGDALNCKSCSGLYSIFVILKIVYILISKYV